jgi:hypothetical protein
MDVAIVWLHFQLLYNYIQGVRIRNFTKKCSLVDVHRLFHLYYYKLNAVYAPFSQLYVLIALFECHQVYHLSYTPYD